MITIEHILCPTDLSPESDEALRYAMALGRAYKAKLLICYCQEYDLVADPEAEMHAGVALSDDVAAHVSKLLPGIENWESIILEGEPAVAITQEAAKGRADLIVMESRRRPRAAALLGSTAEAVCHNAPCPVLVIHQREREWVDRETREIELRRILVAHDFSGHSDLALSYGISFARKFSAELHLIHVLPPRDETETPGHAWFGPYEDNVFQLAESRLEKAVPPEDHRECKVYTDVQEGRPFHGVREYAKDNDIDLICMGVRGEREGLKAMIGSNTDRVLRRAPCPVLIARPHLRSTASS
ncbi:MAG: universal stress protein [Acidobacteria bacterium]|nr:universal stress protein [Acidobacteriota bacterium]